MRLFSDRENYSGSSLGAECIVRFDPQKDAAQLLADGPALFMLLVEGYYESIRNTKE